MAKPSLCLSNDAFLPILSDGSTKEVTGGATLLENMAIIFSSVCSQPFLQQLSPFLEVGAFLSLLKNPKEKKTKTQLAISLILVHTALQHTFTLIPAILSSNPWTHDN